MSIPKKERKLLDELRDVMRLYHYSIHTRAKRPLIPPPLTSSGKGCAVPGVWQVTPGDLVGRSLN